MQRITKISTANLQVAESVELIEAACGGWMLKAWRGELASFVSGLQGPLTWGSVSDVRRFLRRTRPDLAESLTTI